MAEFRFLLISLILFQSSSQAIAKINVSKIFDKSTINKNSLYLDNPPVAENDTFILPVYYLKNTLEENLLENDYDPEGDKFVLTFMYAPSSGYMTIDCDGMFTYTSDNEFLGTIKTTYIICETENDKNCDEAEVVIFVKQDHDNDGIADDYDIDDDNDGILDIDESTDIDVDGDGIVNSLDIDSDGDGIPDNIEAQKEGNYIAPTWQDSDNDGLDDAYDPDNNGSYISLADTDDDGTPDFLDFNSDDDDFSDLIEASLTDSQLLKGITPSNSDADKDGLDDIFDTNDGYFNKTNPIESNVTLPDSDENGIRDWRDFYGKGTIPGENENLEVNKLQFIIYPNPIVQNFNIDFPLFNDNENYLLEIYTTTGKLVYRQKVTNSNQNINPGLLNTGNYLVRLTTQNVSHSEYLIIKN